MNSSNNYCGNYEFCNQCQYRYYHYSNYEEVTRNEKILKSTELGEQVLKPKKFSISYPFIKNEDNIESISKVNKAIIDEVNSLFKTGVLLPEEVEFYEVLGNYEVMLNEKGLLSILFNLYTYINKAAHGYTSYGSITANIQTGKVYSFSDLFNPKIYYVGFLNEIAQEYIKTNNITLINKYNGITPNQQYYLTPDKLVLYYQVYEYTPYYYGLFKIEIPYEKIRNLLTPFSPINKLLH